MTTVCLTIFNRPGWTHQVIDRIALARPSRLLVVADGPRPYVPSDQALCEQSRSVATKINWKCELITDFADDNIGSRRRTVMAIDKVLEFDEAAIIMCDDCVAEPTFFEFCDILLRRFANDERVMHIGGCNFQAAQPSHRSSYYFSRYPHAWGWATWRRAWNLLDQDLVAWPDLRGSNWLHQILGTPSGVDYWSHIFDSMATDPHWDYAWVYTCWLQGGLSVTPSVNLVSNIGWGEQATNTRVFNPANACLPTSPMQFPLIDPPAFVPDGVADDFTLRNQFGVLDTDLRSRLSRVARRWLRRAFADSSPH